MKTKDGPRFDVAALRDLAGEKIFGRGEAYQHDGQVRILAIGPAHVLAQVAGTADYRTEVTGRGKKIGGACSCPAFADRGVCKHMVAAALAANAVSNEEEAEGMGALARIRQHLREKGVDALVEMIVTMAEQDSALLDKLDVAAAMVQADDKTLEARLRKAIDAATRTRGFVDYHDAGGWASTVDAALDTLADFAASPRAGLAFKLAERAIDRIEQAIEAIDDSDGYCTELLHRARGIHIAAACAARPEPAQLARDLFDREMADGYGTFDGAAALYADALGEAGLAEYRRLAVEAWEKLPARVGRARERDEFSDGYDRLKDILDFFAERDGDIDARIALRAKDLSSAWGYLQLVEFCRAHGRDAEALRRAEEGLWMFEDGQPDERLVLFAAELLCKADRKADAEAHLWRAFEKAPSLDLYERLCRVGGKSTGERAIEFLRARLAERTHTGWGHPADLLIRILTRDKMFDAAWSAARDHGASPNVKEALAGASEATHPREALEVYGERVDHLASSGGNRGYEEAAKLIARMATLRGAAEQSAYVAALKARHGRKRNLMKLLG